MARHGLKGSAMPSDPRDYKLDLSSAAAHPAATPPFQAAPRPFLSVHFACCGVYQRVYRSTDGTRYAGHCPKCARPVRFAVGAGGTTSRAFTAI